MTQPFRSALGADTANSPGAAGLWANANRQFTNQVPMVSLVTPSTIDLVSDRVANYQYNPVWGAYSTNSGSANTTSWVR